MAENSRYGQITQAWADQIATTDADELLRRNLDNARMDELIGSGILPQIGGLVVNVGSGKPSQAREKANITSALTIVGLNMSEPFYRTTLESLLKASCETYGSDDDVSQQLLARTRRVGRACRELWLLPMSGVELDGERFTGGSKKLMDAQARRA